MKKIYKINKDVFIDLSGENYFLIFLLVNCILISNF